MDIGPVLEMDRLSISYETEKGWLNTVREVSLRINPREKYGLVGESGSGKSTLALGIMGYLAGNGRVRGGRVLLNGVDLLALPEAELRRTWGGRIGMVFQNPSTALNPALAIGEQMAEMARIHLKLTDKGAWSRGLDMLGKVRMPDPASVARRYPHQLSGGMLQRVLIAMALTSNPQLLIMDEPTTALDVTTEAVVLDLIESLSQEYSSAILYITHNLSVVARLCDRVGVMYAGELMEEAPVRGLFHAPLHPYTRGLLRCAPRVDIRKNSAELNTIQGHIPRLDQLPPGCIFAPRCPLAEKACLETRPRLMEVAPEHSSACLRWQELAGEPRRLKPAATDDTMSDERTAEATTAGETRKNRPGALLETGGLKKYFRSGGFTLPGMRPSPPIKAVDGITVQLPAGLTLGIVGESGCGKTTVGRAIVGLVEPSEGEVRLEGAPLAPSVSGRPRSVLRRIQMVFQNPDASLNPRMTVAEILGRPLSRLAGLRGREIRDRSAELLEAVYLPESYLSRLPEELSGGEKQRVAIARAFAADPDLVICDEPVSALDVSVQGALLNLLNELQQTKGTAYLFISHDLAAVRQVADQIGVVYLGRLWEIGGSEEVFAPPYHPYTEALLSAIPVPDPDARQRRIRLEGSVPSAIDVPSGCRFHTRCPRKVGEICESQEPPWRNVSPDHRLCCHIPVEELLRVQKPVVHGDARESDDG